MRRSLAPPFPVLQLGMLQARRLPVPALDLGLASVLLVIALAEVLNRENWSHGAHLAQLVMPVAAGAAVAARRRALVPAALGLGAMMLAVSALSVPPNSLGIGLAVILIAFTLGGACESRRVLLATLWLLASAVVRDIVDPSANGPDVWLDPVYFAIAFGAGLVVRSRQRQADHVAATADGRSHDAVVEERCRIARELHDVIAHGMSVMVVQADAARGGLSPDQHETRAALSAIERTGRESLREMRRLLGILRDDQAGGAPLTPQPGVRELPELARSLRRAGLPVDLHVDGEALALSPASISPRTASSRRRSRTPCATPGPHGRPSNFTTGIASCAFGSQTTAAAPRARAAGPARASSAWASAPGCTAGHSERHARREASSCASCCPSTLPHERPGPAGRRSTARAGGIPPRAGPDA